MTMHLQRGLSTLNTRVRRAKLTVAKLKQYETQWRQYNKDMRRQGLHKFQYETLDDYIRYVQGKIKTQTKEFKQYVPTTQYRRSADKYSSHDFSSRIESLSSSTNSTARREPQKYTGTYITGIATMHKSNAVPVTSKEYAIDLATMRRG